MDPSKNLTQRSIVSVQWNALANVSTLIMSFFSAVVMARLLPVATFGIYATAVAVVQLTSIISNFGMGGAFLHRSPETTDLQHTAASHFTLNSLFTIGWVILMFAGVFLLVKPAQTELRLAFVVVILGETVVELTQTHRTILIRQVQHQRLALLQMADAVGSAVVGVVLAWKGFGIWALLAGDILYALFNLFFLFFWRPFWRIKLAWKPATVHYFLSFGSKGVIGRFLLEALDRVDDIWTTVFLGQTQLGYYSRAFRFATYPRSFIAQPINLVAGGVYAELKGDRRRLSSAFMRINSLMVRSGFFLAGVLALIAPEFIRIVLGEKWLPMLAAFRLMLAFTLFDPFKQTMANMFIVLGFPEAVIRFRAVQLVVMIAGLFLLGLPFGIAGVALAVDIMLMVGMVILFRESKNHVDYSLKSLLIIPGIALSVGLAAGFAVVWLPAVSSADWLAGLAKATVFTMMYGSILLIWDRQQLNETWLLVRRYLLKR
jgi:O-antigen/teichoic acid export membrane protein